MQLPLDVATPLALIVNEVVSNAFKHAFADGRRGEIVVTLEETAEGSCLEIRDDGIGFVPEDSGGQAAVDGLAADRVCWPARSVEGELVQQRRNDVFTGSAAAMTACMQSSIP